MGAPVRINFRLRPLNRMLFGRPGEVDVYSRSVAVQVARRSRRYVGVKKRRLYRSIRVTPSRAPDWNVESGRNPRADYALPHHQGHRKFRLPRKSPNSSKPVYAFKVRGVTVFTRGPIRIPAFKGTKYLTRAARDLGLRLGRGTTSTIGVGRAALLRLVATGRR